MAQYMFVLMFVYICTISLSMFLFLVNGFMSVFVFFLMVTVIRSATVISLVFIVVDFVYRLFGVIASMYLNSTNMPVIYIRNRMNLNHDPTSLVIAIVLITAKVSRIPPNVMILSVRGVNSATAIIEVISIVRYI